MKRSLLAFVAVVLGLLALAGAIRVTVSTSDGWLTLWFILFVFVGIPLLLLTWVDLGRALRRLPDPSPVVYLLMLLFAVPQVALALVAIVCGATLFGWVLYNSFVKRLPEYSGGFLTFGIGPALISFGVIWLRQALSRHRRGAGAPRSANRWPSP